MQYWPMLVFVLIVLGAAFGNTPIEIDKLLKWLSGHKK